MHTPSLNQLIDTINKDKGDHTRELIEYSLIVSSQPKAVRASGSLEDAWRQQGVWGMEFSGNQHNLENKTIVSVGFWDCDFKNVDFTSCEFNLCFFSNCTFTDCVIADNVFTESTIIDCFFLPSPENKGDKVQGNTFNKTLIQNAYTPKDPTEAENSFSKQNNLEDLKVDDVVFENATEEDLKKALAGESFNTFRRKKVRKGSKRGVSAHTKELANKLPSRLLELARSTHIFRDDLLIYRAAGTLAEVASHEGFSEEIREAAHHALGFVTINLSHFYVYECEDIDWDFDLATAIAELVEAIHQDI